MRALIASPLGLLVGLSLGALGGGGSILAVPALAHGVGESAQMATTTSLLVVGVASLIGACRTGARATSTCGPACCSRSPASAGATWGPG